jgi:iron(III) transport system substrate-binding protein
LFIFHSHPAGTIMRRLLIFLAVLAGPALASCTAAAQTPAEALYAELQNLPPAERQARLEAGAHEEGKLVLINTMRDQNVTQAAMFKKHYPFIDLQMTGDIGSQDAAEQLYAEETAGRHLTDEIVVARPDLDELLDKNVLARFSTPAKDAILPKYEGFTDPQNRWLPFYWSEFGIIYNTNLVPPDKAPKTWLDLCKPFFKGNVSYDPAETRFLAGLATMLGEKGTEDYLKCLGANDPIIQRGHDQRLQLMLAGDHMVASDNYFYSGLAIKRKNPSAPYGMVLTAPILAFAGVVAINRDAPDPYAAALFAEWLMSPESQGYIAEQLRGPVALKHPFLPDDAKLVLTADLPADEMARLFGYWDKYMAKK